MAKKINAIVKIQIVGGKATPAPPVGTALGPQGINLMQFCKEYNAKTGNQLGQVVSVELLKRAAGVTKGSAIPNKDKAGQVTQKQVREIAELKMKDLNALDVDGAIKIIAGTARSMGLTIVD